MRYFFKKLYSYLLVIFFMGCTVDKKPYFLEIVGLDRERPDNYSLRIVEVKKLPDFSSQNLANFIYLSDVKIYQRDLAYAALKSRSFDDMRNNLQTNFDKSPLEPLYAESNGVFRANTFESLLILSAFYHFENIRNFAQTRGLLHADHDKKPLRVAIYGEIYATSTDAIPAVSHDNAVYVGSADIVALFPVGDSMGLPMSMNEGILAHEYHHRLFFNQLWVNNNSPKRWLKYQARYNQKRKVSQKRSHLLLSATDEALADLFAVAYTGLPDFMAASLTTKKTRLINEQRELEGEFAAKATYEALAMSNLEPHLRKYCPAQSRNFTNAHFNIYCLATVIAKVFYEACDKDTKKLGSMALPLIHSVLPIIGNALEKNEPYDLDLLFEAAALASKKTHPIFHKKLCEELNKRFVTLIISNRIPSCSRH